MDTHHVGARMRIQVESNPFNQMECVIRAILPNTHLANGDKMEFGTVYVVALLDGTEYWPAPFQRSKIGLFREDLKPLVNGPAMSNWHEIEKICGWNPTKEVQHV